MVVLHCASSSLVMCGQGLHWLLRPNGCVPVVLSPGFPLHAPLGRPTAIAPWGRDRDLFCSQRAILLRVSSVQRATWNLDPS